MSRVRTAAWIVAAATAAVAELATAAAEPAGRSDGDDAVLDQLDELDARLRALERTHAQVSALAELVDRLQRARLISAYLDVGAFVAGGNGAGIRSDFRHAYYPRYRDSIFGQWVFMGDPLTTMVNSLGEPADIGPSREVATDTLASGGHASFVVNTVALAIGRELGHGIAISSLAQFLPRPGDDRLEIPYAYVTYRPSLDVDLWIDVGKIESVLGIEYRSQDAPNRPGVTPSLICRYICGRPIGIDARLTRGALNASVALTNGDSFEDRFEPKSELHASRYPTLSGHLQALVPLAAMRDGGRPPPMIELGVSAAFGPHEAQPRPDLHQWHFGFDLRVIDVAGWDLAAEYVEGHQQGASTRPSEVPACDLAPCLRYKGAYALVIHDAGSRLIPYVRADWRDAVHRDGTRFVYESHSIRATLGAQLRITPRMRAKLEYIANHELGVPRFPHDVLTTSLVVATE